MNRVAAVGVRLVSCAGLVLAGCSSSGNTSRAGGSAVTLAVTASPTPAAQSGSVSTGASANLSARLKNGMGGVFSAHVALRSEVAGQLVTGTGNETLSAGKLTAMDITEQVGKRFSLRMVVLGNVVYVQLPPPLSTTGKPWLRAVASSTNPVLRQLATSISSAQQSASIDNSAQFATAARSLRLVGRETIDGEPCDHYDVTVDVVELAASQPNMQPLAGAGLTTLPVQLWVNQQNRPVRIAENFMVQGQSVSTLVTVSKYNAPITITAPPADQVGSD
jgi:hypothetical protein